MNDYKLIIKLVKSKVYKLSKSQKFFKLEKKMSKTKNSLKFDI